MNRKILFRGKRVDNGNWVEGYYCGDHPFLNTSFIVIGSVEYQVIPETVCQFTGLTDKNGLKIFEGDIRDFNGGVGCVIWDDVCFAIKSPVSEAVDHEHSSVFISSTLLGNIYDK